MTTPEQENKETLPVDPENDPQLRLKLLEIEKRVSADYPDAK